MHLLASSLACNLAPQASLPNAACQASSEATLHVRPLLSVFSTASEHRLEVAELAAAIKPLLACGMRHNWPRCRPSASCQLLRLRVHVVLLKVTCSALCMPTVGPQFRQWQWSEGFCHSVEQCLVPSAPSLKMKGAACTS